MVRKIDEGWLIRLGGVLDLQLVLVRQSVSNGTIEGAWIIFLSIFTRVRQLEARSVAGLDFLGSPNRLVESLATAGQSVRVVVLRQLVLDAANAESTLGDPLTRTPT